MFLDGVVIFDQTTWQAILSLIHQGLNFLDSIILFNTDHVHLTFLGFDIAVLVFFMVWNTAGLWRYDQEDIDSNIDDIEPFVITRDGVANPGYEDEDDDDDKPVGDFSIVYSPKDDSVDESDIDISSEDDPDWK